MDEVTYTIGELAEQAGVTPRTIRYYTAEGLLPRPDARGQYALYGAEHLLRLRLIARLKDSFLPLGEIRARIEGLSADQIHALLDEETQAAPAQTSSAAEYLAQVLTRPGAPLGIAEAPTQYLPAASPAAAPPPIMQAPAPAAAPSHTQPPQVAVGMPAPAAPAGGLLQRLLPSRRERAKSAAEELAPPAEEQWRRVTLAPGVELHLREPLATGLREAVARLIALARELLGES
jgi:DNA-binding transcriptional MerR regulator